MVVHLTASPANNATRILKESQTLNRLTGSTTTIIGIQEGNCVSNECITTGIEIVRYPKPFESLPRGKLWSLIKLYAYFRESAKWIADYSPTIIVAHSILTLPGCILAGERLRVPVIYDCHELERGTISASSGIWKYFTA